METRDSLLQYPPTSGYSTPSMVDVTAQRWFTTVQR